VGSSSAVSAISVSRLVGPSGASLLRSYDIYS